MLGNINILKRSISVFQFSNLTIKHIHLTSSVFKIVPNNLKGKSKSSQEWLTRQLNDVYVKKSRYYNYRARSAFKLIEIHEKYKLFKPGMIVIDCGAAPGSWTQVAVKYINADKNDHHQDQGKIIALDILPIAPVDGATILPEVDFKNPLTQTKVVELLAGSKANIVLSDMAPNASGIKELDSENIISLAFNVLQFSIKTLSVGGTILCKVWEGGNLPQFEMNVKRFFNTVKRIKPAATRTDSSELFILGKDFKGIKNK